MGRHANDIKLTALANSLRHIRLDAAGCLPRPDPFYYSRLPGGLWRVARAFKGTVTVLGVSQEQNAAALFADCMIGHLWEYIRDSDPGARSRNYSYQDFQRLDEAQPSIRELSNRIMRHLIDNSYVPDLDMVRSARVISNKITSDLELRVEQAKIEHSRALVAQNKLYRL